MSLHDTSSLFDLRGKVAIVTGGSRGLGREMVLAFARHGADVVIASRKVANCESVADEVRSLGRRALAVGYHAASWSDADALADAAYSEFGHVDVLVNNAGMSPLYSSLAEVSEELFDKVIGVNLKGPFRLSANVGTRMMARGGGSIINVSSVASHRPSPSEAPYAAAKAGINGLTKAMAKEWGRYKVNVNSVAFGLIMTRLTQPLTAGDASVEIQGRTIAVGVQPDRLKAAESTIPLGRGGTPEEAAGAVYMFCIPESNYVSGQVLVCGGGRP